MTRINNITNMAICKIRIIPDLILIIDNFNLLTNQSHQVADLHPKEPIFNISGRR
jgi:hypothetical protein